MSNYNANYGTMLYGPGGSIDSFRRLKYYVGDYVPDHSINTGYLDVPKVSALDSVRIINQIGTNITSIPNNKKVITINTNGTLPVFSGPSDYCIITDKFYLDEEDISSDRNRILNALWYRYKLRSYVKSRTGLSVGYVLNAGIYIMSGESVLNDPNLMYRVTIDSVIDSVNGIYECSVWTNFQKDGYYVKYTPALGYLGHRESLNPIPVFKQHATASSEKYSAVPTTGYLKYNITTSGTFSNNVAVWWPDSHQLKITIPSYNNYKDNWYVKIGRGQFIGKVNNIPRAYRNEYYYTQNFYNYTLPIKKIKNDKCEIISDNSVRVSQFPIIASFDGMDLYVKVTVDGTLYQTKSKLTEDFEIADVNSLDGIITLSDNVIRENSIVTAEYFIWEIYHTYRGFKNTFGIFSHVDFNTNYGHYATFNQITGTNVDSNLLTNYTTSFWMNPVNSDGSVSTSSFYHNFNPNSGISVGSPYNQSETIQIGTVNILHHDGSLNFLDGRSRGGGLKEHLIPNKQSDMFWDIGYWEGEPYQSNGVFIVDLNNSPVEKEQVELIVDKYRAAGTLGFVRIGPRRDIDGTEISYEPDVVDTHHGFSVQGGSAMMWSDEEEEA